MTAAELRLAAKFMKRYAAAVESHLYMNMKVEDAHVAIQEAEKLAQLLYTEAEKRAESE